ncbi:Rho-binding antiterminator [Sedimenticola sp.]|uniref:Rho-binding antiterminator n=1 Tax=Sedimenticola sp. TaxID=1940285 RepID=UPI002584B90E|nr:Rho-binding antiterminator [Sedimenticola sp.]MCW8902694.1 Rho-binding antiterminator [Sedimenticola sp.]
MISCAQHDYVEIACMYKLPVTLTLSSGEELAGIAMDTVSNQDREECLKLKTGNNEQLVVLDQILRMVATKPNSHFEKVDFNKRL